MDIKESQPQLTSCFLAALMNLLIVISHSIVFLFQSMFTIKKDRDDHAWRLFEDSICIVGQGSE